VRALNDRIAKPSGRYVLCWLQQALRARDNPVIDAGIRLGNALGGVDTYRSHRTMAARVMTAR
jgi:hypothetical protein